MENQRLEDSGYAEDSGYYAEDYRGYEDFEVEDDMDDDEDIEAFTEDDIDDDDEGFEDYDDDDESIEAFQEDDDDDDEGFEDYDDVESMEDDDDDDEDFDEGYTEIESVDDDDDESFPVERNRRSRRRAMIRWRARQRAKRRANLMKRRARAAQLRAARKARKTQQLLSRKLKRVRGRGRVSLGRMSKAAGTGFVTATLRNGRQTQMMFKPSLATRTDVNRLTRQISKNSARQARAIRIQGKNITLLKSAQKTAIKSLTAQQVKSSKLLTKQITDGDKNLDKRITKLVNNQKKSGRKQDAKLLSKVQEQQRRSTWNSVLIASSIPLFAAYGDRAFGDNANPFSKKNLIITGSTALWLFSDDLINRYLTKDSKKWKRSGAIWNIAAPLANWATVYYFMKDKQHQRFITGTTEVVGEAEKEVSLPVAKDYRGTFDKIDKPVVTATIQSSNNDTIGVHAQVRDGKLYLKLSAASEGDTATVAWKVDTLDPDDQRSVSSSSSS